MPLLQLISFQVGIVVVLNLVALPPSRAVSIGQNCGSSRSKRSTYEFTKTEASEIVDRHNELRSHVDPEPADMRFMNWDYALADMAQQYAEQCIWDHGQVENNTSSFSPIGQNLWLGSGTHKNIPSGISATNAWYNEVQYYNYTTRECSNQCGHYTQVVWADSYAIGCGRHFCETAVEPSKPDSNPKKNVWLIGCHYGLAGNYNRHPYVAGSSCTKCSTGVGQCYNGLCRPCTEHNEQCVCQQVCNNCGVLDDESCTCACHVGFEGNDCSNICENRHSLCWNGWYPAQCSFYEPAISNCPKMCGSCVAPDPNAVCDESTD